MFPSRMRPLKLVFSTSELYNENGEISRTISVDNGEFQQEFSRAWLDRKTKRKVVA